MAKKVTQLVEFTDDLEGTKAEGTVTFSYEGANYEIDLSKKNKTALEKALKPYIDAGRRVRSTRAAPRSRRSGSASASRSDLADVREWAKTQGMQVADRGRVPAEVTAAYDAAH